MKVTPEPRLFVVTGDMGQIVIQARSIDGACRLAQRRYGSVNAPYSAHRASTEELKEHLQAGAVFFADEFNVMAPKQAYALAGLLLPPKFGIKPDPHEEWIRARASGCQGDQ